MDHPLRSPEEILAYRSLKQMLKPGAVWSASPADSVLSAARTMAEKNTGFLVVLENAKLVGVLSERDCIRRVVLAGKSPEATPVADIMVRDVVTANPRHTFVDCLKLMHTHGVRHLPIVDNEKVVGVISVRDLLREAVEHHARVISELERERMMMTTSTA
jgi:signal-transduction protein with cAMP-binding, CBS, and nucleotidyltransferase domain